MQLHYFKMLQKLELSQERYGARLCWTPCLQDPGREVWKRLRDGRCRDSRGRRGRPRTARITRDTERRRQAADVRRRHARRRQVESRWRHRHHRHHPDPIPVGYVWDGVLSSVRVTVDTLIKPERIDTLRVVSAAAVWTAVASHGADRRDTAQGLAGPERMVIGVHRGDRALHRRSGRRQCRVPARRAGMAGTDARLGKAGGRPQVAGACLRNTGRGCLGSRGAARR